MLMKLTPEKNLVKVILLRCPDDRRIHRALPEVKKFINLDPFLRLRRIPIDPSVGVRIR